MSQRFFNGPVACGVIRLSKEGVWFHDDVEITHPRTVELFNRSIRREGEGYILEIGEERCAVLVEDAPFIVRRVELRDGKFMLELSNGENVALDPKTISIGDDNVLYAIVGSKKDRARFSRPAYYRIMEYLDQDENEKYYLNVNNSRIYLPI